MNVIRRAAGSVGAWLLARAGKRLTTGGAWPGSGGGFMDAWNTLRRPDAAALVREYESVAYAFATINASVFASTPYRLIVKTEPGQKAPRVPTRRLSRKALDYLRTLDHLRPWLGKAIVVEEVESHALLDLLNYRLLVQSQLYLEVVGHAPHVIQAAKGGLLARVPTRLLALPAHEVQPTPGDSLEEPVAGFKWRNEEFAVDDILWLRFPSLRDPLCGYSSPTIASWEELSLRERQSSRMNATLDNDSIPAAVASPRGEPGGFAAHMDPDQATALEASIIRKFRRGGAGKIAVLSHPLDITPLNVTPRDQEMAKHHDIAKATCSNNYGVPLAMLSSQTNLANLQAARQQHAEQAIEPRCKLFDETFNEQVTARFDGRLALVHDSPVPEDLDQRIKNRESMLKSGRTLNQILEAEGEAPIDGPEGDLRYVPTSLQEVTIVDMAPARPPEAPESPPPPPDAETATEPPDDAEAEKQAKAAATRAARLRTAWKDLVAAALGGYLVVETVDQDWLDHVATCGCAHGPERRIAATVKGWDDATDTSADGHGRSLPSGARLTRILRSMFAAQERAVFGQLGLKLLAGAAAKADPSPELLANLNPDIDLAAWNDQLAEDARPVLMIEAEKGARDADIRLGATDVEAVWNVQLPEVEDAVRDWSFKFSASTNGATSERINDAILRLKNELTAGILDGDNTLHELTKRVHAIFDQATKYRAKVIAATEASRAVHAGQAIAARQSGLVAGFRLLVSGDACPHCLAVEAAHPDGVALGEPFTDDGGTSPYSLTLYPPLHPWCACTVTEIYKPIDEIMAGEGWAQPEETSDETP